MRGGRLPERRAREALEDLDLLGVHWYSDLPLVSPAWSFRDNASAYDATYLALAEVLGAGGQSVRVLTLDARLARPFRGLTVLPS